MGREIKRVAIDFDWPNDEVWKGYLNPYTPDKCPICGGSGYNAATKQISDDWYDFANTGRKWCNAIDQYEVDALLEHHRLMDFTHKFESGKGWIPVEPRPEITADMVNKWNRTARGFDGHDSINQWICVETRAKRLGVWGECPNCKGSGDIFESDENKEKYEAWERSEPPAGDGWQVWETVSEGSPVSPVFKTPDELIGWLIGKGYSRTAAEEFVKDQWVPSMAVANGKIVSDIECAAIAKAKREE